MLLTTFLFLISASFLVPTTQYFIMLLSRLQRMLSFVERRTNTFKENRAFRRRLMKEKNRIEKNRITKTRQFQFSTVPIAMRGSQEAEAYSIFLSVPYLLSATSKEEAWNKPTKDGQVALGASRLTTPRVSRQAVTEYLMQQHISPQPISTLLYVFCLLLCIGMLATVWVTVINVSCLADPGNPLNGGSNLRGGGKGSRKRKRQETRDYRNTNHPGDRDNNEQDGDNDQPYANGENGIPRDCFWACPFYKFDPVRHARCLGKYGFKRFVDVKQHIERCHVLKGFYYCPRCWHRWGERDPWVAHVESGECLDIPEPELIRRDSPILHALLSDEFERLNQIPRGLNKWGKWYEMWHRLFHKHGHTPPELPYVEDCITESVALVARRNEAALRVELPAVLQLHGIPMDEDLMLSLVSSIIRVTSRGLPLGSHGLFRSFRHHTVMFNTDEVGDPEQHSQAMSQSSIRDQSNFPFKEAPGNPTETSNISQVPVEPQLVDESPYPTFGDRRASPEVTCDYVGPEENFDDLFNSPWVDEFDSNITQSEPNIGLDDTNGGALQAPACPPGTIFPPILSTLDVDNTPASSNDVQASASAPAASPGGCQLAP
ncbi:hypothetical protein EDB80DRAFT_691889 [Ilyonectria destructans]|nr:hypothetical protein EDB80DRAFT_691889 [Ilyonectria destructans]